MSLFPNAIFGGYGFGGLGLNGYGSIAPISEQSPTADTATVKPKDPVDRSQWVPFAGRGSFPGFDVAPPPSYWLFWQIRRYSAVILAHAVVTAPILAGTRTVEVADDQGDPDRANERKLLAEQQLLPALMEALEAGLECLHFGAWLQEVEWGRAGGYTLPVRYRSFLPGEAVIYQDKHRDFTGFQVGDDYRDTRYAFLAVNDPHIDPIHGYSRNEGCREDWWRARQINLDSDKLSSKASGIQMMLEMMQGTSFTDSNGKAVFPKDVAQAAINAAKQGMVFTVPSFPWTRQEIVTNPALKDFPMVKVTPFDWKDTSGAQKANLERLASINIDILRAWHRPEREALEAQHGSKADSNSHGAIGKTDSELVASMILRQFSKQVVNRWLVTNFGPDAIDTLYVKQSPLSDPQQEFLQKFAETLATDTATGPALISNVDQRKLLDRTEVPMLSEEDAKAAQVEAEAKQKAQLDAQTKATMAVATAKAAPANGNGTAKPKIAASGDGDRLMLRMQQYMHLDDQ